MGLGLLFMLPITFIWALMSILIRKLQNNKLSEIYLLFFVTFFVVVFFSIFNVITSDFNINYLISYSYIGVIGYIGYFLFIYSLKYINIGIATLIANLSIIFTGILNFIFLGEYIVFYKQVALLVVFVLLGIYTHYHYRNSNKDITKGLLLSIISSFLIGLWFFVINYISKTNGVTGIELKNYTIIGGFFALFIYLLYYGKINFLKSSKILINKKYLFLIIVLLAVLEIVSDGSFFHLHNYYNGTILAILTLFEIFFSFVLGYLFFKEKNTFYEYMLFIIIFLLLFVFIL